MSGRLPRRSDFRDGPKGEVPAPLGHVRSGRNSGSDPAIWPKAARSAPARWLDDRGWLPADQTALSGAAISRAKVARHRQLDCPLLARFIDEIISGLGLDHRPVLPNEHLGNADIWRLHVDAAGSSSDLIFHLKMKCIAAGCICLLIDRLVLAAHFDVPPFLRRTGIIYTDDLAFGAARLWRSTFRISAILRPARPQLRSAGPRSRSNFIPADVRFEAHCEL
jgi:hypothetical protein